MRSAGDTVSPRDTTYALGALVAILVVTAGWWALALWPAREDLEWLTRARVACFNVGSDGLPDLSGWMLLVGQPVSMLVFLWLVWPSEVVAGLGRVAGSRAGRVILATTGVLVLAGVTAAAVRVKTARAARTPPTELAGAMTADDHPRLDRAAPALDLVDQHGARVSLDTLRGRPAIVTFAFANCHDVCPLVVAQARAVREAVWAGVDASLVIVTLDPWRDTPARLPALAANWGLKDERAYVLGGSVDEVEAALDRWNVARTRDMATGQVSHPPMTYLLDAEGRIAFVTLSGHEVLLALARRVTPSAAPTRASAASERPGSPPTLANISDK